MDVEDLKLQYDETNAEIENLRGQMEYLLDKADDIYEQIVETGHFVSTDNSIHKTLFTFYSYDPIPGYHKPQMHLQGCKYLKPRNMKEVPMDLKLLEDNFSVVCRDCKKKVFDDMDHNIKGLLRLVPDMYPRMKGSLDTYMLSEGKQI